MRILHVVTVVDDANSYGGPLTVAVNQCSELRRRGHDARIMAGWLGSGPPPDSVEGVPAHLFPVANIIPGMRFSGLFSFPMLRWLRQNADTFDAAHLHAARDLVPLLAGAILHRNQVRYVTQTHGMVVPDRRASAQVVDRLLTLSTLRNAAIRFVLTEAERDSLEQVMRAPNSTAALPNAIAVANVHQEFRNPLNVLFMARLHPRKRVLTFAQAAANILEAGHQAQFSVVGPDDGDLANLRAFLAERPWMQPHFTYEGSLDHPSAVKRLSQSDIYVLPSVDEPFPMTVLEALSMGIPTICTASCGLAATLRDSGAAYVSGPEVSQIESAITRLLLDEQERKGLSQRAQLTIEQQFSVARVADTLELSYAASESVPR